MPLDFTYPHIAWDNLLAGATYTVTAGIDNAAAPFSNAFNGMMSSIANPQADANGVFAVTINISNQQIGFNTLGFGVEAWGGISQANLLIIGGSRHNAANQHWTGGTITVNGANAHAMVEPSNQSILIPFANGYAQNTVTLSITGLQPNQAFIIPELFYGNTLQMPYPELGIDPTADIADFSTFKSVSGMRYDYTHFVKWSERVHWKYIDTGMAGFIEWFRENSLEKMAPFWWIYNPESQPRPIFVKHINKSARMPYQQAAWRDFSLNLEEVLL